MDLADRLTLTLALEAPFIEKPFAARNYYGDRVGPGLIEVKGHIPIVLSAPHAVNHPREGHIKLADLFTGTITIQLAQLTGANALVYARTTGEDPNYSENGAYKKRLEQLLEETQARFVLDIHGMSQERLIDIAFGTNHGKTLGQQKAFLSLFSQTFLSAGFREIDDDPLLFSATRSTTIANFIWNKMSVPSLQLEIHKRYRDPIEAPRDYVTMLLTICDALNAIQELL